MRKLFGFAVGAIVMVLAVCVAFPASAANQGAMHPSGVLKPVKFGISPVLRNMDLNALRRKARPSKVREMNPREINGRNNEIPDRIKDARAPNRPVDTAVQTKAGPLAMPSPTIDFEGVSNIDGVLPPDTEGDVGANYYVQWVNLSFDIFNKSDGTSAIGGPVPGNSLWSGFGGTCETDNYGDPIVLYDHIANRWLMAQFTSDNHECIAISQTSDPTGSWYLYSYLVDAGRGDFPDYPKFGVWPDGYYFTANMFGSSFDGAMAAVFERDKMLTGDPNAQMVYFFTADSSSSPSYSMLPANLDGMNLPPAGEPNPISEIVDDAWGYDAPYNVDSIVINPLHVDWTTPANSTFGPAVVVDMSSYPFDTNMCSYNRSCIPQPNTSQGLDALSDRLLYRLHYRNFGTYQDLVGSHTVDVDGSDHAGTRWFELRNTGSGWTVYQAGTYAPDANDRWMGDAAMDTSGDIAVGYSVSSSTVYPSIAWAGRLVGDPLGDLSQGEATVVAGGGSQTSTAARWGDYSTMSVDPTDDCTFWYTQEYLASTGSAPWKTHIAAFKFPSCTTGPTGTIQGTVTSTGTGDPIAGALVQVGGFSTTTANDGTYSITIPADTYDVTASKFGFVTQTVSGIVVGDGDVITQDFALDPAGTAFFDGYVTDAGHGWPLYAKVELAAGGSTVATVYSNPFNGYYEVELPQGSNYDFTVTPIATGYTPMTRTVLLPPAGTTVSFSFVADHPACTAPGFTAPSLALNENFNGSSFPPAGWTVTDDSGGSGAGVWESTATTGRTNSTGGTGYAADADSDWAYGGMNTTLYSPVVDVSSLSNVTVEFKYDFNYYTSGDEAKVDISGDGGATWTNLADWTADTSGTFSQDVTSIVGGSTQVQLRFIYNAPGWDWYFLVDDVKLYDPTAPCSPVSGAMAAGFVTDANTTNAIVPADVTDDIGDATQTMATPGDTAIGDGYYQMFVPVPTGNGPSTRTFTASASKYADVQQAVNLTPETVNRLDFALPAGWLEVTPANLKARLYAGQTEDQALNILNHGGIDANVRLLTLQTASWVPNMPMDKLPQRNIPAAHLNDRTARNIPAPEVLHNVPPYAAGDIISSWASGLTYPWGTGVNQTADTVWLGNISAGGGDDLDYEYTRAGSQTGTTVDTSGWMGSFAGDMAFDANTGMMWQLAVGGDNCIHEWDPSTGTNTGNSICWGATTSERGLAYDPDSQTFFVGGWNTEAVTRFDTSGNVLQVANVGLAISGLAYNPLTHHLFVMTNASPTALYVLDVDNNYNVIGTFSIPGYPDYGGAGLAFTCDGHLWAPDQSTGTVYEVDSGENGACLSSSLPWLTLTPGDGTVPAAGTDPGQLPIDAQFIADGAPRYGLVQAQILVAQDTPYQVNPVQVCFTKAFNDMTPGAFADAYVHAAAGAGITTGCGDGNFCPSDPMTRGVMALWLEKAMHGADYEVPPCQGIFADVPCESTPNAPYIEALYNDGVTAGCATNPLRYCPDRSITRAEMAVFLLKASQGSSYTPPACTGVFDDVACPGAFAVDWIEDLYSRGITAGCSATSFCPSAAANRDQMAVFVTKAFNLPMCPF
ncbi:MAG: hypothetical protein GXP48_06175 [Acidobacteria bacterium]|nr:hypothetical protein [Acidobacteriota bacterium]